LFVVCWKGIKILVFPKHAEKTLIGSVSNHATQLTAKTITSDRMIKKISIASDRMIIFRLTIIFTTLPMT